MATIKQQLALKKTLENGGNVSQAMREVGYSEATVNNPSNLTQSKGYKEILADCGLTESFIVKHLVEDIIKKPEKRLGELTLASDLLGLRKKGLIVDDKTAEGKRSLEQEEFDRELAIVFEQYYKAKISNQSSITMVIPKKF